MNLILAILLFLLTTLILYAVWYIVRGRSIKERAAKDGDRRKEESQEGKGKDYAEKISKDSYCYPTINEMMGYEFVSVINVPDELVDDIKEDTLAPSDWEQSHGVGLTAVPGLEGPKAQENDDPYPENDEESRRITWGSPSGAEKPIQTEEDKGYETSVADIDISDEELNYLTGVNQEWAHREYDDTSIDDVIFNNVLDNNPEMIERSEPTEEDLRTSMEREQIRLMREAEEKLADIDNGMDEAAGILDGLDEPSIDDEGIENIPEEDDIPEID